MALFEYILEPRNKVPIKNPEIKIAIIPIALSTIYDFFISSPIDN